MLLYSAWWQWDSPFSPGPRYTLTVLPLLALVAALGLQGVDNKPWIVAKILIGLGILVQLPAVLLTVYKLPSASVPSVWLSFRGLSGWWSLWNSVITQEPIAGFSPGIDCLSTGSSFFLVSGLSSLMAGGLVFWSRSK